MGLKKTLPALCILVTACNAGGEPAAEQEGKAKSAAPKPALVLSSLETSGKRLLDGVHSTETKAKNMQASVKLAMAAYLFDPGSAQFMNLRSGRAGAVCGKYNAKNRYGAYTGYKDFVLSKDGKTVFASEHNDGVQTELYGSFAEAYVNACASAKEKRQHAAATAPAYDHSYDPLANMSADVAPSGTNEDPFEGL